MTFAEFTTSLTQTTPPAKLTQPLQALWEEAKGNWDRAHQIAQGVANAEGSWVHAYLHRKEGDLANAHYWYSRAGKNPSQLTLAQEWEQLVKTLLTCPSTS